jgi:cathepsin D
MFLMIKLVFLLLIILEFAGFKLYDHPIGTVVKQSSYFTNKPFDGILGLGFSKISSISENSLMDRLKENGLIKRKMFSLLLTSYGDKASELLFDDVNPEHFKGNLMPVNVTSNSGFWIITLDGAKISVDGKTSLIYFRQNQAIMDTGSTMIYAPRKAADALHKRIPGAKRKWFKNHYTFPCHVVPKITLNFIIHDMQVSILPENLSLGSEDGGKTCISAISSTNENEWILGSSFLRNVYSVWDAESEEISFASLSQ